MGEKKCPFCGEWSEWTTSINDTCKHCGKPLSGKDLVFHENRLRDKKSNEEQWIFYIHETDSDLVKSLKKVGNVFYTIYISIITFLAWVIAALPG